MTKRSLCLLALLCLGAIPSVFAQGVATSGSDSHDDWTLEKARNAYWNSIRTSGEEKDLGVIERKSFEAFRNLEDRKMLKSLSSAAWVQIGSSVDGHGSGRLRDIAFDPSDKKIVYVAAASGGVWKTNDITQRPIQWINLTDRLPTTNFGAVAVDPSNGSIIYIGSGEPQGDQYQFLYGPGIYKSTDGGNNWTLALDNSKNPGYISEILIDATNTQRIYATTASSSAAAGFVKSTDGGSTWKTINAGVSVSLSLTYNPAAPNRLYLGGFSSAARSSDFGETWTKITATGGIVAPSGKSLGRIDLACAPSAPNIVYASIGNPVTRQTLGLWVSNDSGVTWRMKSQFDPTNSSSPNPLGNQQEFCNTIAVRPTLASQIIVAGLDVYTSGDSGKTFQKVSDWIAAPTSNKYVHADIHHLEFADNTNLYACTDGGLATTTTSTSYSQWATDMNLGISSLQFVGADADKNLSITLGGCQDNGTVRAVVGAPEFHLTRSGDGGRTWISPDDPSIAYATYVYSTFYKSLDSGKTWGGTNLVEANTALYRDDVNGKPGGEGAPFYPAYDVSSDGTVIAYGGNSHVWISMSGGSDAFNDHHSDKAVPSAYTIHLSKQDPTYMFAGSGNNLWRSTDEGVTWTNKNLGEYVTGITSDPTDHTKVFVVTNTTGATKNHFFESTDGGATFTNPTTQLAGIPCWSVAYDAPTHRLFVGSDNGMVYSEDGGVTWYPLTNGMPYARVTSLKIKGNYLLASTYGRGLYSLDMSSISGVSGSTDAGGLRIDAVLPNPMSSGTASVRFTLPAAGYSEMRLFDALGREVKVIDKNYYESGLHELRFAKDALASGTYVVTLISGGRSASAKLVIE